MAKERVPNSVPAVKNRVIYVIAALFIAGAVERGLRKGRFEGSGIIKLSKWGEKEN